MKPEILCAPLMAAALTLPVMAHGVPQPSVQQATKVGKAQGLWLDVRTPEEFRTGYIDGAINIPVDQLLARIQAISPNKNSPLHLYCRSGRRSEAALQMLKRLGYTNITNHGGYQDLVRQGIR